MVDLDQDQVSMIAGSVEVDDDSDNLLQKLTGKPAQEPSEGNPGDQDDDGDSADDQNDEGSQDGQGGEGDNKPQFYTAEELSEMGQKEDFDKIDTSRIPPEMMPIYKSFQAMATRKQQRLSQTERQMQQLMANHQAQAGAIQADPAQLMNQNPQQAAMILQKQLQDLDVEIEKKMSENDVFEGQKLMWKRQRLQGQLQTAFNQIATITSHFNEMYSSIPDLQTKAPALTEFVTKTLDTDPLTEQEINYLTNPAILGKTAVKLTRLINTLYDQSTAAKATAQQKLTKPKPKPTVQPGSGRQVDNNGAVNPDAIKAKKKRAMQSGSDEDWADYISDLTSSQRKKS